MFFCVTDVICFDKKDHRLFVSIASWNSTTLSMLSNMNAERTYKLGEDM